MFLLIDEFISFQLENRTLHLFDVVARQLPSLESILDHFLFMKGFDFKMDMYSLKETDKLAQAALKQKRLMVKTLFPFIQQLPRFIK